MCGKPPRSYCCETLAKLKRTLWDRFVSTSPSMTEYELMSEYWKKKEKQESKYYIKKCASMLQCINTFLKRKILLLVTRL